MDEAIEHYQKALALNPRYPEACNNLGQALAGKGDDKNAIAQFEKAVRLDSMYSIARANLGMLLARTGQADKAIVQLEKVMEGMPNEPEARRDFGNALMQMGKFREARAQLEKAVEQSDRRDPLALFLLCRVYANIGRTEDAALTGRKALSVAAELNDVNLIQAIGAYLNQLEQKR
jgi:Tfp pilus assembly protein PilF